ncbi:MAG: DUF4258 domain-containing protein [Betaproteobacteria bacterium]|nr:DUF4258 domain-containing protein [Betaproteobacteria bacterium]
MRKYVLSSHAKTVITERSIKTEWLEQVFAKPDKLDADPDDPDLKHAFGRIAEHGNRVLRVVYNDSVRPIMIVTVYFDRGMRNKP